MKKFIYAGLLFVVISVALYVSSVWYYTFVHVDPWGVEKYLSMKGLKGATIYGDWNLQVFNCARPSKLIGEFSQYTSIAVACEEFDIADITNCTRLESLTVFFPGVLKNFALLKQMGVAHVSGDVDVPITDFELLRAIEQNGWRIGLRATTNTMVEVCVCPRPDLYSELDLAIDVFQCASQDDISHLRKQEFAAINGCRQDFFWQMFDMGVFCYRALYYAIGEGEIRELENTDVIDEIFKQPDTFSGFKRVQHDAFKDE